jgi:hypothetical protein
VKSRPAACQDTQAHTKDLVDVLAGRCEGGRRTRLSLSYAAYLARIPERSIEHCLTLRPVRDALVRHGWRAATSVELRLPALYSSEAVPFLVREL